MDHNLPHGIFNHDRNLNRRDIFKQNRSAAPAEWRQVVDRLRGAAMRRIRDHLLRDRGIDASRIHTRGYWKLGETAYPDHDYGKD